MSLVAISTSLTWQQVNTATNGDYTITKTYVADPSRSVVLISTTFDNLGARIRSSLYADYLPQLQQRRHGQHRRHRRHQQRPGRLKRRGLERAGGLDRLSSGRRRAT